MTKDDNFNPDEMCNGGCGMHPSKCLCEKFIKQRPFSKSWKPKKKNNDKYDEREYFNNPFKKQN